MLLKILIIILTSANIIRSVPVSKIDVGSADNPFKNTVGVYADAEKISTAFVGKTPHTPHRKNLHSKHHNHLHTSANFDYDMLADQPLNDDGFKRITVRPLEDVGVASTTEKPMVTASDEALAQRYHQKIARQEQIYRMLTSQFPHADRIAKPNNITNLELLPDTESRVSPTESSNVPYKLGGGVARCVIPRRVKDNWKDNNNINLYFDISPDKNRTLTFAVIRFYKKTIEISTPTSGRTDIDKIRVTVSYYIKDTHGIKTYIADSKVITLSKIDWVEFDIKTAFEAWDTHNLGLSVTVEGIDQVPLNASNYFITQCMNSEQNSIESVKPYIRGNTLTLPSIKTCTIIPGTSVNCTKEFQQQYQNTGNMSHSTAVPRVHTTTRRVRHHHDEIRSRLSPMSLQSKIENKTVICPAEHCDNKELQRIYSTIIR